MRYALMLGFVVVAFAGCVAAPINLGPASNTGPVVCDTNCTESWQRAQFWITRHSKMKIQTATDVLVQTYNPSSGAIQYGFTASREPLGSGRYRISLEPVCADIMKMCSPRSEDVVAAFNYYVATGRDVLTEVSGTRFNAIH